MLDAIKNFFIKAWQGKLSLPMAFFVLYYVPPMFVMGTVYFIMYTLHPDYFALNDLDNFTAHTKIISYVLSTVLLPYTIFTVICVWRCARNSSSFWLIISRMIVAFALAMSVINFIALIAYLSK